METPYGEIPDRFVKDMAPDEMFDYLKKRYSRRRVLKGAAAAGVLGAAGPMFWRRSYADASTAATPPGAQWIAFGSDPGRQMWVSWAAGTSASAANVPAPKVRWGLDTTYGNLIDADSGQVPTPTGGTPELTLYQHALLTDLTPDTTYHYSVSDDGNTWGPDTTFTTGKTGVVDFRFAATGDENSFVTSSQPIMQSIASFHPDFTIVAGDLAYASDDGTYFGTGTPMSYTPSDWDTYFAVLGPSAGQSIPWMVGPGNHDVEPFLDNGFGGLITRFPHLGADPAMNQASGSKVVQSFVYGNVGFVGLDDSDISALDTVNNGYTDGKQTTWFEEQLQNFRAPSSGVDFIVVFFHHCPYCSGGPGSDGGDRTVWQPLFDQYDVDLVVNGHNHLYERIYPLKNNVIQAMPAPGATVDSATVGTTYICTGGGGQSLAATPTSGWNGTSGGGDLADGSGPNGTNPAPIITEYGGGETASGGAGAIESDINDPVTGWSAYRRAQYCHLIIDVTAPTTQGGQTSMFIRAIDPTQSGSTISSITPPETVMDSVTLTRTSVTGPGSPVPALAEAPDAALLVGGAAAIAGGAYYLAQRRHAAGAATSEA